MFTGIIEETGEVQTLSKTASGARLVVKLSATARGLAKGGSVAVNGCCLTAVSIKQGARQALAQFDLLGETLARTNLGSLAKGSLVNLERPLRADGRFDGHFVTGHIDGTGVISKWEQRGADWLLEIKPDKGLMRYFVPKGSIAVDGISLTVAKVMRSSVQLWIIPHTYTVTNLQQKHTGGLVNLEADILGKYVVKFLSMKA